MNLNDAYPCAFLKADDLKGNNVTATIHSVSLEELGKGQDKERKLIIGFVGKDKKLVCNKTNAGTIGKLYGPETDDWIGKRITLCPREVEFQGEMMLAIRVSLTAPVDRSAHVPAVVAPPPPAPVHVPAAATGGVEDDVPF